MLCPEVWNFPPPRTVSKTQQNVDLNSVNKIVNMNNFYRSLVVTCPDELQTPGSIADAVLADNYYYKLSDCPVTVFLDLTFVESFVKTGQLYCLTTDRDCITKNCAAITPDGTLKLHVLDYTFQTLGLEGTKQSHNYYEVNIDLKNTKLLSQVKQSLIKLETFDFFVIWEPHNEDVCPSSIAKYFYDQNMNVSTMSPEVRKLSPTINEIPSLKDVEAEEIAEWIGLLALEADLTPSYDYVSSYSQPESENPIKSTRISLLIVKGFISPDIIRNVCSQLSEYAGSRELDNFWSALSFQGFTNSPWRWTISSPSIFEAHDCSTSVFLTKDSHTVYSIREIKIS